LEQIFARDPLMSMRGAPVRGPRRGTLVCLGRGEWEPPRGRESGMANAPPDWRGCPDFGIRSMASQRGLGLVNSKASPNRGCRAPLNQGGFRESGHACRPVRDPRRRGTPGPARPALVSIRFWSIAISGFRVLTRQQAASRALAGDLVRFVSGRRARIQRPSFPRPPAFEVVVSAVARFHRPRTANRLARSRPRGRQRQTWSKLPRARRRDLVLIVDGWAPTADSSDGALSHEARRRTDARREGGRPSPPTILCESDRISSRRWIDPDSNTDLGFWLGPDPRW